MPTPINILIIEDHPVIINAYLLIFKDIEKNNSNIKTNIRTAKDCDSAKVLINNTEKKVGFDLVLLDINIPSSKDYKLLSGEDIGLLLKNKFKNIKTMILTSTTDNHKLHSIFQSLNPEGFLVKSDFSNKDLVRAITDVINGNTYYSQTITTLIRNHMSNQIELDKVDRTILYHISQGAKMKDLPKMVNLSLGGVERRKRHLRDIFDTKKKDDRALIERAKEKGFI